MAHRVTLLPGDGIGPEVTAATLRVLEATGIDFEWDRHEIIGISAVEDQRPELPDDVPESIREHKVALKGPITTPVGEGFTSVNVQLRQRLDLYANVRPCVSLPGLDTPYEDINLIIFRENTEGLYAGIETYDERLEIADSIARITRRGSERIVDFCFRYAEKNGRNAVTLAHKANILKKSSGLFLQVGREVAERYPDIAFNDRIIDNMCMQLVMYPQEYDCIVSTNLFGDILSDLAAGLVGGLGVTAGANFGDDYAVFEAVHGSAPDIAGQGIANPTALIRSAVMMLRHLDEVEAANTVNQALREVYAEGDALTADVGGSSSTMEFAEHLAARVEKLLATSTA
ncbi:MAG: isocitrate/isopropylmalate dehydrogenase family protein [Longimonas sp.]|uniref:isocitrate/isopropylmalate dehydrogenase family protein n=1 Tax=Longimonas sp. TaxID=2039626 RepID=UPI003354766C